MLSAILRPTQVVVTLVNSDLCDKCNKARGSLLAIYPRTAILNTHLQKVRSRQGTEIHQVCQRTRRVGALHWMASFPLPGPGQGLPGLATVGLFPWPVAHHASTREATNLFLSDRHHEEIQDIRAIGDIPEVEVGQATKRTTTKLARMTKNLTKTHWQTSQNCNVCIV